MLNEGRKATEQIQAQHPSQPGSILVLALGNPLRGDDGIGAAVLEALKAQALPKNIRLVDGGTAGLETCLLLQGHQAAILIDAAEIGQEPGTWRWIKPDQLHLPQRAFKAIDTVHSAGLAEALHLAQVLDLLPPDVTICAIQPAQVDFGAPLSPALHSAIPTLCAEITARISALTAPAMHQQGRMKEEFAWPGS